MNLNARLFGEGPVMDAWDRYVEAVVKRYKGKVSMYEVWNEPDGGTWKRFRPDGEQIRVFGTEGTGLPKGVISACDYRVMIPMMRGVDSLNVAAASAISFWELMK